MERYSSKDRRPKHPNNWRVTLGPQQSIRRHMTPVIPRIDVVGDPIVQRALRGETVTFTPEDPAPRDTSRAGFQIRSSGVNGRMPNPVELGRSLGFFDRVRWPNR